VKEFQNTLDNQPQPVVPVKRKRKQPIPDKKQRADRNQEIKVRLEEINNERVKHNSALSKMTPERSRLLDNLQNEKKRQQVNVDDMLSKHFESTSSGKLVDKVLQSEMIQPVLNQLQGNIDKLDHSISWHRSKLKSLAMEEHQLGIEADRLSTIETAYAVYDQLQILFDAYQVCIVEYEKTRQLAAEAEALDRQWFTKVQAPSHFHATVADTYLTRSLGKSSFSAFVTHVQAIGGPLQPLNPFHVEAVDRDTAETDAHVPLRRANFNTPRSIIK
jgi:hypothetical protein